MAVQTQIQVRRGTAATWTSTNPTLAAGEIGFESDTGKIKVGTGSATWNSLTYIGAANAIQYVYNASAGQTTFSGADANGATLAYTVGAEQVYVNGVLQVRNTDYTATNGTSVVLTTATIASDIVTVVALGTFTVADTYTQAQANAKFIIGASDSSAGKNAVINGGFDIWQRGTSIATSSANVYTADRWATTAAASASTITRQATGDTTNLPNIQYCLRFQRNSGQTNTTAYGIYQAFETTNSIPFVGKTVTLSFYARAGANYSPTSSLLGVQLFAGTGTDQNPYSGGYTGQTIPINTTQAITTTWARYSFTVTLGSTITEITPSFYMSPTGTAGANDYFEITGVQLELGSVATAFARNASTIQGELAACQRYYWRTQTPSTANPYQIFTQGSATSTTIIFAPLPVPVTMRTSPSSVDYSALAATADQSATLAITNVALANGANSSQPFVVFTVSGATQFRPYQIQQNNNVAGYIGVSAEL